MSAPTLPGMGDPPPQELKYAVLLAIDAIEAEHDAAKQKALYDGIVLKILQSNYKANLLALHLLQVPLSSNKLKILDTILRNVENEQLHTFMSRASTSIEPLPQAIKEAVELAVEQLQTETDSKKKVKIYSDIVTLLYNENITVDQLHTHMILPEANDVKKYKMIMIEGFLTKTYMKHPKPTQPTATAAATAMPIIPQNSSVPNAAGLAYNSALSGSTGAKLYKNSTEKKWVVKKGASKSKSQQAFMENVANDVYALLGVPVPRHKFDYSGNVLVTEYIPGKLLKDATPEEFEKAKTELCAGFIVDALIANWDVIGMVSDNIILPADGSPAVRIDNGGSFDLKATGGKKKFSNVVIELHTMRNAKINPTAAKIYGDLTDDEINAQITSIIVPKYDAILALFDAFPTYKPVMKSRLDYLVERLKWYDASTSKAAVAETATPQYLPQVQAGIVSFFRTMQKYTANELAAARNTASDAGLLVEINNVLKRNGAIVSGGFILKSIGKFTDVKSVDIDIYVPTAHIDTFKAEVATLISPAVVSKELVTGDASLFFKKNGILSITKYVQDSPIYAEMDVVEVKDDRTPIDVVKNFDLTFCENWYDGEQVYMTYPDHVEGKYGYVENNYLMILTNKHPVLLGRIKKYAKRGFKIRIYNPVSATNENITNAVVANTFMKHVNIPGITGISGEAYGSYGTTSGTPSAPLPPINMNSIKSHLNTPAQIAPLVPSGSLNSSMATNRQLLVTPFDASGISAIDIIAIKTYTGNGYGSLNKFLYTTDRSYAPSEHDTKFWIFKYLREKFPQGANSLQSYNNKLIYLYFVNLYNALQKRPYKLHNEFKVFRGTGTWYLTQDKDKYNYINAFTSTSYELSGAFVSDKKYIFYVHPDCVFMNVTQFSSHPREKEILLAPYHRYYYVREETAANGDVARTYVVLPTDLAIPNTYEEFMSWKITVPTMTTPRTIPGGRLAFANTRKRSRGVATKNLMTRTNVKGRTRTMNSMPAPVATPMPNTETASTANTSKPVPVPSDEDRLTGPLPSFVGSAPTPHEMDIIKRMVAFLDKH